MNVTFLATEGPTFRTLNSATSDNTPGRISAIITGLVRSRLSRRSATRVNIATVAAVTVAIDPMAVQVVVGVAQWRDARNPVTANRVPKPTKPKLMVLTTPFVGSDTADPPPTVDILGGRA